MGIDVLLDERRAAGCEFAGSRKLIGIPIESRSATAELEEGRSNISMTRYRATQVATRDIRRLHQAKPANT